MSWRRSDNETAPVVAKIEQVADMMRDSEVRRPTNATTHRPGGRPVEAGMEACWLPAESRGQVRLGG